MKLTEAKLKQMILEAIKNKRMQDFDIPTPDDKLKSDLGDQTFDKIQSLDIFIVSCFYDFNRLYLLL